MTHPNASIWSERLLLALILASVCATLNLVRAIHRYAPHEHSRTETTPDQPHSTQVSPNSLTPQTAKSEQTSEAPTKTQKRPDSSDSEGSLKPIGNAPQDPTKEKLAVLARAVQEELEATSQSDHRAEVTGAARRQAEAESRGWKRREALVRQQVSSLTAHAKRLEQSVKTLDAERDVLAQERDLLKAALAKASQRSGFAVLPYRGPNGTWRRPIVLECTKEGVRRQPHGPSFGPPELSPRIHPRSSPIVRAVAREMFHIQSAETPDGARAVAYVVFLVRPDGIRSYYEARASLEPLGIAFGYELVDQNLAIEVPDLDDLTVWDGSVPLDLPLETSPEAKGSHAMNNVHRDGSAAAKRGVAEFPPELRRRPGGSDRGSEERARALGGAEAPNPEDVTPGDFVWPSRPRTTDNPDGLGSGPDALDGTVPGGAGESLGFARAKGGAGEQFAGDQGAATAWPGGDQLPTRPRLAGRAGQSSGDTDLGGTGLAPNGAGGAAGGGQLAGPFRLDHADVNGPRGGAFLGSAGEETGTGSPGGNPRGDGLADLRQGGVARGAAQPASEDTRGGSSLPDLEPAGDDMTSRAGQGAGSPDLAGSFARREANGSGLPSGADSSSSPPSGGPPSSSTSVNLESASSTMTGLPLGRSSPANASSSGSPGLSFGQDTSSTSEKSDEFFPPHIPLPQQRPGAIEVPFEIVIVCRQNDILLHPGAYLLTTQALLEPRKNGDSVLARELRAMVRRRAIVDPLIRPRPSLRYIVESHGGPTFWLAWRQLLFSLPDWPMSLQVYGSHDLRVFNKGTW
jgi:hypothetical protein